MRYGDGCFLEAPELHDSRGCDFRFSSFLTSVSPIAQAQDDLYMMPQTVITDTEKSILRQEGQADSPTPDLV